MKKRGIVWFRQDLRLHDNEAIHEALRLCDELIYVYVFDDRWVNGTTKFGFAKTRKHRLNFIIQSVQALESALLGKSATLIIKSGNTEDVIFDLAIDTGASWVFCNRERTEEEVGVQDALERRLWTVGREIRYSRGKMLYYTQDLPFPVTHTPDQFTSFRKEVEKITPIREPLNLPLTLRPFQPLSEHWKTREIPQTEMIENLMRGGESEGLKRVQHYLWESDAIANYKSTRNELIGQDFSSRFSPWLAHGCLSPKWIYAELKKYEDEFGASESSYWLYFELLWRDFFRLMGKKHGNKIFQSRGYASKARTIGDQNEYRFQAWASGKTGTPLIDALMIELNSTGWLSNRGRQIAASFLVNDLKLDWRMGAEWFESMLIDYDPCSNYGNWAYLAGVGSDTRNDRYFNILSQAKRYDPQGKYVKTWLPDLAEFNETNIHTLDNVDGSTLNVPDIYSSPIIPSSKWS